VGPRFERGSALCFFLSTLAGRPLFAGALAISPAAAQDIGRAQAAVDNDSLGKP